MTEKNNFERGDRVRIVSGMWAGSGIVVSMTKNTVKVRLDAPPQYLVAVLHHSLERIE